MAPFPACMPALTGRALGLTLIFLTAIIWVAASFVSQLLVTHEEGRPNFNVPPFLLTYLSTSIFTVFLPLVQLKSLLQETWLLRRSFKYKQLDNDEESAPMMRVAAAAAAAHEHADADALVLASATASSSDSLRAAAAAGGAAGGGAAGGDLTADLEVAEAAAAADAASAAVRASRAAHRESLVAASQCFLLWFIAQFLFNQSLQLTSVTSNTILSSTSSLFTFALSMIFLREPYSAAKLLSIAACMGGTLLVTLSDDSSGGSSSSSGPSHSVWGDMLCLVSAGFYACYTIVLRKALPDDDEANVALFFGYVGLLCSVAFAPVVALLGGIGALHLKTIPPQAYGIILIQGILNYCLSDYLWAHAVLLLGPTIATLGLSVQIPVAAVVEAIIGHPKWLSSGAAMAMTLSGTGLIMAGFVAGNLAGGGHVYGSHHREDITDQPDRCRSPGGLADDSFTDGSSSRRHTPQPPPPTAAALAASPSPPNSRGGSPSHYHAGKDSNNHNSSRSSHTQNFGGGGVSKQQQQQSCVDGANGFTSLPVSTHAGMPSGKAGDSRSCSSPRNSSPGGGRPPDSPYVPHSTAAAAAAGGGRAGGSSSGGGGGGQHSLQQQRVSQQWESIELSSSFGSETGSGKSGEHSSSPSAMAMLRPREQLPQAPQRSPLGQTPPAAAAAAGGGGGAQSAGAAAVVSKAAQGGLLLGLDVPEHHQQHQQSQQQPLHAGQPP